MRPITTLNWMLSLLLLLIAGGSLAAEPPDEGVKRATERLQVLIGQHHDEYTRDKAKFYAVVDEITAPAFDVAYVAQIALGRAWRTATDTQRKRFQAAFKNTLIHAYSDALLEYGDSSRVEWGRASIDGDTASLRATVLRNSAQPITLGFELRKTSGGNWGAYDISVEGVSLVTNFRSQFTTEVKRNGLDELIQRLEHGDSI